MLLNHAPPSLLQYPAVIDLSISYHPRSQLLRIGIGLVPGFLYLLTPLMLWTTFVPLIAVMFCTSLILALRRFLGARSVWEEYTGSRIVKAVLFVGSNSGDVRAVLFGDVGSRGAKTL